MDPIIDHIGITVRDLDVAESFYDRFLPVLGFDLNYKSKGSVPEHEFDVVEYYHPLLIFAINSPREAFKDDSIHRRKPGALHHLAFKAKSRDEVDRLYHAGFIFPKHFGILAQGNSPDLLIAPSLN